MLPYLWCSSWRSLRGRCTPSTAWRIWLRTLRCRKRRTRIRKPLSLPSAPVRGRGKMPTLHSSQPEMPPGPRRGRLGSKLTLFRNGRFTLPWMLYKQVLNAGDKARADAARAAMRDVETSATAAYERALAAASAAYNEAVDAAEHTRQQAIRAAEAIKPPRPP